MEEERALEIKEAPEAKTEEKPTIEKTTIKLSSAGTDELKAEEEKEIV